MTPLEQDSRGSGDRCQAVERIEAWPYARRCKWLAAHHGVLVPVGDRNPGVVSVQPGGTGTRLDLCDHHWGQVPL